MFTGLLTATVFLPAAGALGIAVLARGDRNIRLAAVIFTAIDLILALWVMVAFDYGSDAERFQLIDRFNWMPKTVLDAKYHLGVDGLSAPLVLLTALLGLCAVFASWNIKLRVKEYFVLLLVLQTAVLGVFSALDFILFFIFWELELLPMYLLIAIWGTGRKEYSAMKFLVFTLMGSAFMLVAIVALFLSPVIGTFDMTEISQNGIGARAQLIIPVKVIFWFFMLAFAIKLPLWPLHTWLPDAHTDAPTAVSVMLAGVLLKMGGYGLIRISAGMFPDLIVEYRWPLVALGVITILYGAMVTLRQTDLKRLIAYSSVSHMGLVMVGVASVGVFHYSTLGLTGAAMQMFTHGTITALLFLLVGLVYDRAHTRYIPDLGGLAHRMPIIASVFLLAGLASLGLPGLSGFVSELFVLLAAFKAFPWVGALAAFGIIITAGYILWMMERVFFGAPRERFAMLPDASAIDVVPLVLLVISIVAVGVYPAMLTNFFDAGIRPIIGILN